MSAASFVLHAGSAAVCLVWTALVLAAGRGTAARLLAAACGIAALWAASYALALHSGQEWALRLASATETGRWVVWLLVLGFFFRRVVGGRAGALMPAIALAAAGGAAIAMLVTLLDRGTPEFASGLGAFGTLARLMLALLVVLMAENLFRTAGEAERWHVGLPAIVLGGLSAYDVLVYAEAALSQQVSVPLLDARAALTAAVTPLLAVAAVRDARWRRDPPVSRQVVFHGATLVVAGAFLLAVGALGEILRWLDLAWGATAQISLLAVALIALAVALTSGTVRSRIRSLIVDHFFTARYDYRREWLRAVAALSAAEQPMAPEQRAIRVVADVVDSPAGILLQRDPGEAGLRWTGSWNLPAEHQALGAEHPIVERLGAGQDVLALEAEDPALRDLRLAYGPLWLAVPLLHGREGLGGVVLLAPPRAPFKLDREVTELLRMLGRQVAMFLAERRAAERLVDERRLADYAKRFAFVAHDVKTVSSQLSLLLANAEENLADPEFQHDMLVTVRASTARINALIARLGQPGDVPEGTAEAIAPLERLRALAAAKPYPVEVAGQDMPAMAAIAASRFDTAIGHLMNNAADASPPGEPVRVVVSQEGSHIVVEVTDRGPGMSAEFVRDELFRPLSTSKRQGSGIGAWQARELLREAGGELTVLSRPGAGTTMRIVLPARGAAPVAATVAATASVMRGAA